MLADPDVDGLFEPVDCLVVEAALGPVGTFDKNHPAGQPGGRAAVVEKGQPRTPTECVRVVVGITNATEPLEQPIELLQPLAGRLPAVGFAQARTLDERLLALRLHRLRTVHLGLAADRPVTTT